MADMRASEVWYGREADPATDYADSAAAPVRYAKVVGTVPVIPAGYEEKPAPPPSPPVAAFAPAERVVPPPPPPATVPAYTLPEGMAVPGVQLPDGRFEPHPLYVRSPPPVEARPPPPVQVVQPVEVVPVVQEKKGEEKKEEEPSKHVTELEVPVCCEACEERVANYLIESGGVEKVDVDVETQKVTVTGDAAPADVLQMCKKCFRKSRLL